MKALKQRICFIFGFIFILIPLSNLLSQTIINYDYKTKVLTQTIEGKKVENPVEAAKYKSDISFRITNFNPFLLKATIKANNIDYHSEVPSLLNTNLLQLKVNSAKEESGNQKTNTIIPEGAKATDPTIPETRLSKLLKRFNAAKDSLEAISKAYSELQALVLSDVSIEIMVKGKEEILHGYLGLKSCNDGCKSPTIFYCESTLKNIKLVYKDLIVEPMLKTDTASLRQIKETMAAVVGSDYPKLVIQLNTLYDQISIDYFSISSEIVPAVSDETVFEVTVSPISDVKDNPYNNLKPYNFNKIVSTKGGVKIDFSAGLFSANLVNQKFTTIPIQINDSTSGYQLVSEKSGLFNFGILALMHATWRTPCHVNFGANLGIGVDLYNSQALRYLAGGSVIFGKNQRFILNGGLSVGQVDRLSSALEIDKIYDTNPTISTVKLIDVGWYIGITYNITGK